jgi:hypothetical protein
MATATIKRRTNKQTNNGFLTKWESYFSKRRQEFTIKNAKKKHKTLGLVGSNIQQRKRINEQPFEALYSLAILLSRTLNTEGL